jgi:hypothetical protein
MPKPIERSAPLSTSCHCGAVRIEIAEPPKSLTQCNCSICRRTGALWAYYTRKSINLIAAPDALETYTWQTHRVRFQRCRVCGSLTHWDSADTSPKGRFGVNMRNTEQPAEVARTPIEMLDGDGDWETLKTWVQPELFISPSKLDQS